MNPIDAVFEQLRREGRKAFIPFLTCGDPTLEVTVRLAAELARRGASLIELGVPYSDPIADGPVIQASYTRALERGVRTAQILQAVAGLHRDLASLAPERLAPPLALMVSYSIVFRRGPEQFVKQAKEAGIAGIIVPDLPIEEAELLAPIARREDFKLIQLITPTTPRDRAVRIARSSSGFLYFVSVTGITGERAVVAPDLLERVTWLKQQTDLPVCIGFGVSRPEHVRTLAPVADGVIVGSAIVRRVAEAATRPAEDLLREVGDYVSTLLAALNGKPDSVKT